MPDHLIMLRGERIELGPIRRDLLETYVRWFNDLEVTRTLAVYNIPMTLESEENWFERASLDNNSAMFTIFLRESGQAIGNVGLHDIDNVHGTANFGIVIGEKSVWNQGYGTETTRLMLQYGFDVLGLSNIMLEVYGTNPNGIRAYEKAGFRHIGMSVARPSKPVGIAPTSTSWMRYRMTSHRRICGPFSSMVCFRTNPSRRDERLGE